MSAGISTYLGTGFLGTLSNAPLVVPMTCIDLHIGDPGNDDASDNLSVVGFRVAATFAAPIVTPSGLMITTTGAPPEWDMTAAETIQFISVHDDLTAGHWLWTARLATPQIVAEGDLFTMGGGIPLIITGLAA